MHSLNLITFSLFLLITFVKGEENNDFYRLYPCSASKGCPTEIPSSFRELQQNNMNKPVEKSADAISVTNTNVCVGAGTPFSIITSPTIHWPALTNPCPSGQYLADINASNWNQVQQVAYLCGGSNSFYWVNSWNTDTYCNAPLVLVTGSVSGFGTLVSVSANSNYGYICQDTPSLPNTLCPTTTTTSSSTATSSSSVSTSTSTVSDFSSTEFMSSSVTTTSTTSIFFDLCYNEVNGEIVEIEC